jgi:hypothetical protein
MDDRGDVGRLAESDNAGVWASKILRNAEYSPQEASTIVSNIKEKLGVRLDALSRSTGRDREQQQYEVDRRCRELYMEDEKNGGQSVGFVWGGSEKRQKAWEFLWLITRGGSFRVFESELNKLIDQNSLKGEPTGRIIFGDEEEIREEARYLVNPEILAPGGTQVDGDSCVYFALGAMTQMCTKADLRSAKEKLGSYREMRQIVDRYRCINNGKRRLDNFTARELFNREAVVETCRIRSEMALDNENVGDTAGRILSDGYVSMLEVLDQGHAVVCIGQSGDGEKLIVWDPLLGDREHGLREINKYGNLGMYMCAKINSGLRR